MGDFSIDQNGDTTLARCGLFEISDSHLGQVGET
jgi:hypothetical protein